MQARRGPLRGRRQPEQVYRVEGIGRRGAIRHVKVVGNPGHWRIIGVQGLLLEVRSPSVEDAVRIGRRRIPFRPIAIRKVEKLADE